VKPLIVILVLMSCSSCASTTALRWRPDASYLDVFAEEVPGHRAIRDRLVSLYESVHARDWPSVYEYMTDTFRDRVDKDSFVRVSGEEKVTFDGYKILSYGTYRVSEGDTRKRFIVRFVQGHRITYEVVWWRLQNGLWHAENIGLPGLSLDGIGDPTLW
jgi:hypothetical protein